MAQLYVTLDRAQERRNQVVHLNGITCLIVEREIHIEFVAGLGYSRVGKCLHFQCLMYLSNNMRELLPINALCIKGVRRRLARLQMPS